MGLAEGNAASFEQIEHELKMLQFLNGNGVELFDPRVEVVVFFQSQRGGRRLAFEVRVVHENGRDVRQHLRQPVRRNLFAEQEHKLSFNLGRRGASGKTHSPAGAGQSGLGQRRSRDPSPPSSRKFSPTEYKSNPPSALSRKRRGRPL